MQERKARFVEGNLFRHVAVMALTSSVGLMAVFFVDLINMVYISWLGRAELAAAIGYAGAVLFFTTSFGIGMSIAVSVLVSRAGGSRDPAAARVPLVGSVADCFRCRSERALEVDEAHGIDGGDLVAEEVRSAAGGDGEVDVGAVA